MHSNNSIILPAYRSDNAPKILISKISRLELEQECEVILSLANKTKNNITIKIDPISPSVYPHLYLQEVKEISKDEIQIKSTFLIESAALKSADPKTMKNLVEDKAKEKVSLKLIPKKTEDPSEKMKVENFYSRLSLTFY